MKWKEFMKVNFGIGILLAVGALSTGCGEQAKPEGPPPPLVQAYTPGGDGGQRLDLRGSVTPQGRLRLGFKQAGVIGSIRVREGDRVRAGQVLAVLDEIDAQAQLRTTKAALDRAQRDADRTARLVAEGALPMNQRDDTRNQLEASQAQWLQAQDGLNRTRLLAPVSGTVFQRMAEPGETVGAGAPVLTVDTTDRLVVKTGVTERELKLLRVGQRADLIPEDGSPALTGRVTSIAASPNSLDGLYQLELAPDGPGSARSRPGALLGIRIEASLTEAGVRVPLGALVHRQDQDYVFVIESTPTGRRVHARSVRRDRTDGTSVILRAGLQAGERIVAEGAFFLQDGQAVRTLE